MFYFFSLETFQIIDMMTNPGSRKQKRGRREDIRTVAQLRRDIESQKCSEGRDEIVKRARVSSAQEEGARWKPSNMDPNLTFMGEAGDEKIDIEEEESRPVARSKSNPKASLNNMLDKIQGDLCANAGGDAEFSNTLHGNAVQSNNTTDDTEPTGPLVRSDMRNCGLGQHNSESDHFVVPKMLLKAYLSRLETVVLKRCSEMENKLMGIVADVHEDVRKLRKDLHVINLKGLKANKENRSSETALSKFTSKLKEETQFAEWIFDADCLSKILRVAVCATVVSIVSEGELDMDALNKEAFHTLMFSLLPGGKSFEWKKGVGQRHSKLRKLVVLNAIVNTQRNRFGKFLDIDCNTDVDSNSGDGGTSKNSSKMQKHSSRNSKVELNSTESFSGHRVDGKIEHPKWLKPGFITMDDIEAAQRQHEETLNKSKNGSSFDRSGYHRWYDIKEVPNRQDIAKFGAFRIFSLAKAFLHSCRRNAKRILLEQLFYLMVPWSHNSSDIEQDSVSITWASNRSSHANIAVIPLATCIKHDKELADKKNSELFSDLLVSDESMLLAVRHKVAVGTVSSKGRRSNDTRVEELRRVINLIDVAARFCTTFSGCSEKDYEIAPFLGGSELSLRTILTVSFVLRDITEEFVSRHVSSDGSLIPPTKENWKRIGLDTRNDKKTSNIVLNDLVPGPSDRNRLLESRCLFMSPPAFSENNVPLPLNNHVGKGGNKDVRLPNERINEYGTDAGGDLTTLDGLYEI